MGGVPVRDDRIQEWLEQDLKLTRVADLLARRGVEAPYRTLHRYAADELGFGGRSTTVPVVDGEPRDELQIDFGRMGMMFDPVTGWRWRRSSRRTSHGAFSCRRRRRQELVDVIAGCEAPGSSTAGCSKC